MSEDPFDDPIFEGMYFGLHGEPITLMEWSALLHDLDRRRIGHDVIEGVEVSTVWLGIDHGWGLGPKLLFETMTFAHVDELAGWCRRYPTRELAELGHEQVCEEVRQAVHERTEVDDG